MHILFLQDVTMPDISSLPTVSGTMNALYAAFLMAIIYGFKEAVGWVISMTPKRKEAKKKADETFAQLVKNVTEIKNEITVNGGTKTIKDVVGAISVDIKNHGQKLDEIESSVKRMRAQQRVRFEQQLNDLVTEATFICDETGGCTFVNKACEQVFGLSKAEMLGKGWTVAITTQAERKRIIDNWEYTVNKKSPYEEKYDIYNKVKKESVTVIATAEFIYDDDGNFMHILGKIKIA